MEICISYRNIRITILSQTTRDVSYKKKHVAPLRPYISNHPQKTSSQNRWIQQK